MNSLTLCLYSVSNGHWSSKDCYLRTIQDLETHKVNFADKIVHIKIRPGEEEFAETMEKDFIKYGYRVLKTVADWRRWHGSHSVEQLKDIFTVFNEIKTDYIFHLEDDWKIKPISNTLEFWLEQSINLLKSNSEVLQVRIPRQINEFEHFKSMEKVDDSWKKQGELFSLNPHIIKKRDLSIILQYILASKDQILPFLRNQQMNVEMLFAEIGKRLQVGFNPEKYNIISNNIKPFWSHSSENIRALHIGNNGPDDTLEKVQ
jgi:hypothetical protein